MVSSHEVEILHADSFGPSSTYLPKVGQNAGVAACLTVEDAHRVTKVRRSGVYMYIYHVYLVQYAMQAHKK